MLSFDTSVSAWRVQNAATELSCSYRWKFLNQQSDSRWFFIADCFLMSSVSVLANSVANSVHCKYLIGWLVALADSGSIAGAWSSWGLAKLVDSFQLNLKEASTSCVGYCSKTASNTDLSLRLSWSHCHSFGSLSGPSSTFYYGSGFHRRPIRRSRMCCLASWASSSLDHSSTFRHCWWWLSTQSDSTDASVVPHTSNGNLATSTNRTWCSVDSYSRYCCSGSCVIG